MFDVAAKGTREVFFEKRSAEIFRRGCGWREAGRSGRLYKLEHGFTFPVGAGNYYLYFYTLTNVPNVSAVWRMDPRHWEVTLEYDLLNCAGDDPATDDDEEDDTGDGDDGGAVGSEDRPIGPFTAEVGAILRSLRTEGTDLYAPSDPKLLHNAGYMGGSLTNMGSVLKHLAILDDKNDTAYIFRHNIVTDSWEKLTISGAPDEAYLTGVLPLFFTDDPRSSDVATSVKVSSSLLSS